MCLYINMCPLHCVCKNVTVCSCLFMFNLSGSLSKKMNNLLSSFQPGWAVWTSFLAGTYLSSFLPLLPLSILPSSPPCHTLSSEVNTFTGHLTQCVTEKILMSLAAMWLVVVMMSCFSPGIYWATDFKTQMWLILEPGLKSVNGSYKFTNHLLLSGMWSAVLTFVTLEPCPFRKHIPELSHGVKRPLLCFQSGPASVAEIWLYAA